MPDVRPVNPAEPAYGQRLVPALWCEPLRSRPGRQHVHAFLADAMRGDETDRSLCGRISWHNTSTGVWTAFVPKCANCNRRLERLRAHAEHLAKSPDYVKGLLTRHQFINLVLLTAETRG